MSGINESDVDLAAACAIIGIAIEREWLAGGSWRPEVAKCVEFLGGRTEELSEAAQVAEKAVALLAYTGMNPDSSQEVARLLETRAWPLLMERVPLD